METLSKPCLFRIFNELGSISLVHFSVTSNTILSAFLDYFAEQSPSRQQGLAEMGLSIFTSQFRQHGILRHTLFRYCNKLSRIQFMMDLPLDTLTKMHHCGHLGMPEPYPHDIEVEKMTQKLPMAYLQWFWSQHLMRPEVYTHTFSNPDDSKRFNQLFKSEKEHTHVSRLTLHLMNQNIQRIKIDDRFLRLLTYWILVEPMAELCSMHTFYRVHLNHILPWILLFPQKQRRDLFMGIARELNLTQMRYLAHHLRVEDLVAITTELQHNAAYVDFLRGLHGSRDRDYIDWLRTSKDGKSILKKHVHSKQCHLSMAPRS